MTNFKTLGGSTGSWGIQIPIVCDALEASDFLTLAGDRAAVASACADVCQWCESNPPMGTSMQVTGLAGRSFIETFFHN